MRALLRLDPRLKPIAKLLRHRLVEAIDTVNGEAVMNLLADLHREGATICMVTHDPRYAEHAQRTIHLFDGRVVRDERNPLAAALGQHGFEVG